MVVRGSYVAREHTRKRGAIHSGWARRGPATQSGVSSVALDPSTGEDTLRPPSAWRRRPATRHTSRTRSTPTAHARAFAWRGFALAVGAVAVVAVGRRAPRVFVACRLRKQQRQPSQTVLASDAAARLAGDASRPLGPSPGVWPNQAVPAAAAAAPAAATPEELPAPRAWVASRPARGNASRPTRREEEPASAAAAPAEAIRVAAKMTGWMGGARVLPRG
mmetsp:Transcript_2282/g.7097  ORF Transcript_2282/g.7097 Transcript_2282/m.7097 type:complete len:220 (+) Transcript_2282:336-995(+)